MGELINIATSNFTDIAKLTGQDSFDGEARSTLVRLKINTESTDDDENTLPPGSFTLMHPEFGNVYAKTANLRIFVRGFQYIRYDSKDKEKNVRSIIIRNWGEEAVDSNGTIRCGKVTRKEADTLTGDAAEYQKSVTCFQQIIGLVTLNDAVTAKGVEVEVVDMPVRLQVRGKNFMAISEIIDVMTKKRREMIRTNINMSLKREKNGSVTYYVIQPTVDFTTPTIWRGDDDMEVLTNSIDYFKVINDDVMKYYTKALKSGGTVSKADKKLLKDVASLENDFTDDPLPEIMSRDVTAAG